MKVLIIAKYSDAQCVETGNCDPVTLTVSDSIATSYTGKELGLPNFYDIDLREKAEADLKRAIELNPGVGYAIHEVEISI